MINSQKKRNGCAKTHMTDWDDIRFFLAVARTGSVSGAAKVLTVNHSTVSRRIQGFEKKQGVRLFERTLDGYAMTEAAEAIYELALQIENQHLTLFRHLQGQDSRLQGKIHMTMPHDIYEFCLADEIKQFQQKHQQIELYLHLAKGVRNLANREADMAIRLTATPPDYLVGKQIATLQHGIYASKNLGQEGSTEEGNTEEESTGIVAWVGDQHLPDWAQEFHNPYIALRVDDLYSMYVAVKSGIGVARMPCYLPDAIGDSSVQRLDIPLPRSTWGVWVLNHIDLRGTTRIQACREALTEALVAKKGLFEGECSV